jgi:hypothetical protein
MLLAMRINIEIQTKQQLDHLILSSRCGRAKSAAVLPALLVDINALIKQTLYNNALHRRADHPSERATFAKTTPILPPYTNASTTCHGAGSGSGRTCVGTAQAGEVQLFRVLR